MCARINADSGRLWDFYMAVSNAKAAADGECEDMSADLKKLGEQIARDLTGSKQEIERKETEIAAELKKDEPDRGRIAGLRSEIMDLKTHVSEMTQKESMARDYLGEISRKKQVCASAFRRGSSFLNQYISLLDGLDGGSSAGTGAGTGGAESGTGSSGASGNAGGGFYKMTFRGVTFYCNDSEIDASRKDSQNRTNLQRMQKGMAPIASDGLPVNIHHMQQSDHGGGMMELKASTHAEHHSTLHINSGSAIPSGINRTAFNALKRAYWKQRAKGFM